jgi:hypothetical protein
MTTEVAPEVEEVSLQPKKGVQFHSRNSIEKVQRISAYTSYSEEEVVAYWGEDDEHHLRKQELRQAAKDCQSGRRMSDNLTFSTKGLVNMVGMGREDKRENRQKSRDAVLDEQDLQEVEGLMDDELLSDIYTFTTKKAKRKAHQEALDMAEEVKALSISEGEKLGDATPPQD